MLACADGVAVGRITMAVLAGTVALGYFAIALVIAPKIKMPGASPRLVLAIRGAAIAFFIGCGMTHVHILLHTLGYGGAPQAVEAHELAFHSAQAIGAWLFIIGAVLRLELHIVPSQSRRNLETAVEAHRASAEAQRTLADEARAIASRDELTGLARRWRFDEELERQVSQSSRYGRTAALIMIDVDGLKVVNDTSGHLSGDRVLRYIAAQMVSTLRPADIAARIGGDEFAIILPEVDLGAAESIADRLVALSKTPELRGVPQTSISVGVMKIDGSLCPAELVELADIAMYDAKRAGGDRSVSVPVPGIRLA